jgi:hypothetical protein
MPAAGGGVEQCKTAQVMVDTETFVEERGCQEPAGLRMTRLRKRENSPCRPAFWLRSAPYAPQNRNGMASLSHSLASIPLRATGS